MTGHSVQPTKLRNTPNLDPLDDEDIAAMVEASPMRTNELAGRKMLARFQAPLAVVVRALAHMRDDVVFPVKHRHPRRQVRNHHVATPDVEVARQVNTEVEAPVLSLERELLKAIVAAVGHEDRCFLAARIANDAVRAIELPGLAALSSKRADVVAVLVVLDHIARPVAVPNIDVAVGSDGQIRGPIDWLFAIRAPLVIGGFLRIADSENLFAIERRLDDDIALDVAHVEKLLAAFKVDVKAMSAALEIASPGLDELPVRIEHDGGVAALTRLVDRMVDVNHPVGVLHDSVDVPITDVARQLAPIVDNLVSVLTAADDGVLPAAGGGFRNRCRAHGRPVPRPSNHLRAVDDVADVTLEIAEERQAIALGLDEVVDYDAFRLEILNGGIEVIHADS